MMADAQQDNHTGLLEQKREREATKFLATLPYTFNFSDQDAQRAPRELIETDSILTAIAQLATLRTGTSRAVLCLYNGTHQCFIAEATPSLGLEPTPEQQDDLACGRAVRRRHGSPTDFTLSQSDTDDALATDQLPVTVVNDLGSDARFSSDEAVDMEPTTGFYAGVAVRTPKGANIGVLYVLHPSAVDSWNEEHDKAMRETSRVIMRHLESRLAISLHRRSERMIRGVGSFMEQKSTMSGWQDHVNSAMFRGGADEEGSLNARQQFLQHLRQQEAQPSSSSFPAQPASASTRSSLPHSPAQAHEEEPENDEARASWQPSPSSKPSSQTQTPSSAGPCLASWDAAAFESRDERREFIQLVFSKAANLMRESVEVEGCLFLDTAAQSFQNMDNEAGQGSQDTSQEADAYPQTTSSGSGSGSSEDDNADSAPSNDKHSSVPVLGFSTTHTSSLDGDLSTVQHRSVGDKFLKSLLKRYPRGKIFNLSQDGDPRLTDSSEEEKLRNLPWLAGDEAAGDEDANLRKQSNKPWARKYEVANILKLFPGARSVAFTPVWDPRRSRWYACGFTYTQQPMRVFTVEGELSFLRAFSSLCMIEVLQHELALDDKAKHDVLSSISHELRSPLHGIILGAELLNATDLSVAQGDLLHSLETCGRTLTDTLDHLLDFSKVNHFKPILDRDQHPVAGKRTRRNHVDAGLMSLSCNVDLDLLTEEVIDCVFAGFNFQHMSVARPEAPEGQHQRADTIGNHYLDDARARDDLGIEEKSRERRSTFGDVSILFKADPMLSWNYYTQPGALRRIIMNLVANSLKHTENGIIKVTLEQKEDPKSPGIQLATLTVSDTGRGISEDFIRNQLYKPFTKENSMDAGSGLGLSLVKQIISQLRGRISIQSRKGKGTTIRVTLPFSAPPDFPKDRTVATDDPFLEQRDKLKGLRICLMGFDESTTELHGISLNAYQTIENVCSDGLLMEVVTTEQARTIRPDLVMLSEKAGPLLANDEILSKVPCVMICANAIHAHQRFIASQKNERRGIIEHVSQPVGPRKLGKMLLLAFSRWANLQAQSGATETTTSDSHPTEQEMTAQDSFQNYMTPASLALEKLDLSSAQPDSRPTKPEQANPPKPSSPEQGSQQGEKEGQEVEYLLVDDNKINLQMISMFMQKLGRKYRTAVDGEQAVRIFKDAPSQCRYIFTDITMPVMDGFEATRLIRAHEKENKLAPAIIVALTGLASAEAQRDAFACGMDLILTKPVKLKELASVLKSRGMMS